MSATPIRRALAAAVLVLGVAGCGRDDPATHIATAREAITKGDYGTATVEIKNALAKKPDDAEARFLLAKVMIESGNPSAAETEVRKAIDLKYPPDKAFPLLALALEQQGQWKRLLTDLGAVKVDDPAARAELRAMQAIGYVGLGQQAQAKAAVAEALAIDAKSPRARLVDARITAMTDLPAAIKQVDAILAERPDDIDAILVRSDFETAMGRPAAMRQLLAHAVKLQPGNPAPRYSSVIAMVDAGQIDEAAKERDVLKKLAPSDPRTLHADALIEFTRGNVAGAQDAIQKSLRAAPEFLPALYLSGLIDLKRGANASAEQSLQLLVSRIPDDPLARRALAQTYLQQGNAGKAMETLEPAIRRNPNDPKLLRQAGEIMLAQRNPKKSAEFYERANALDKGNVDSEVKLAQVRMAQGDTAKGMKDLESLTAKDSTNIEADIALVNAHLARREFDQALTAADAVIRKTPKSGVGHEIRGRVLFAKGDLKGARANFDKALATEPGYVPALYDLARIDALERDFKSARSRFEQVLAKNKDALEASLGIAEVLIATGAPAEEVVAAYQRAIAANPTAVPPRVGLVLYGIRRGDAKGAVAAAQSANAAIPDSLPIVEALGSAQLAAGETNQALDTFKRLVTLSSQNPGMLVRLAEVQARAKDLPGALASLKTAMTAAPESDAIVLALATVYQQSGQVDAGLADARKWQRDNALRAAGFELEGELLARSGKATDAEAAFRSAMTAAPSSFAAMRLHSIQVGTGKGSQAAADAAKWLKDHPKDFAFRVYLGQSSLGGKDFKTAEGHFRAANDIQPDNPTVLNNLAWALYEQGDAKSLGFAERAYLIAPLNPEVLNTYGATLILAGKTPAGLENLRRAADLAPTDAGKRLDLGKALAKSGDKAGARKELEAVAKGEASPAKTEAEQLLKTL
jgi:cellulose synthase operon protein C